MRTEKQIAASRANGAKSRGRKPRPGNPWADYRALGRALLLEGESSGLFDDLASDLAKHLQPQSPVDHLLIGNMLAAHWRKIRLWHREQENGESIGAEESRLDRQFYRAYDRYMKNRPDSPPRDPANQTPVSTCENPIPAPEPTETQQGPGETQQEPGETQPEPAPARRSDTSPDWLSYTPAPRPFPATLTPRRGRAIIDSGLIRSGFDLLKLTKKADYGLIALRHLASIKSTASAKDIADAYHLPVPLLAKVLQKLTKEKILRSVSGTNGGYGLARDPERISALEVIRAIDGPVILTHCFTEHGVCDQSDSCTVREPLRRVHEAILELLNGFSITDLAESPSARLTPLPSPIQGPLHQLTPPAHQAL